MDQLIKTCVCTSTFFCEGEHHNIPTNTCNKCGIIHQRLYLTKEQYFAFYSQEYHTDFQVNRGTPTYDQRYSHDLKIATMRLEEYSKYLQVDSHVLDIGSSNNAFVDVVKAAGYQVNGIEIGQEGANHPETTYHDDLLNLNLPSSKYDLITLHDVFEHLIDPIEYLIEIRRILSDRGVLVIDFPHFFVPAGLHHWKPVEHLWFFTLEQLTEILNQHGMEVVNVTYPIPSKFVVYCKKV